MASNTLSCTGSEGRKEVRQRGEKEEQIWAHTETQAARKNKRLQPRKAWHMPTDSPLRQTPTSTKRPLLLLIISPALALGAHLEPTAFCLRQLLLMSGQAWCGPRRGEGGWCRGKERHLSLVPDGRGENYMMETCQLSPPCPLSCVGFLSTTTRGEDKRKRSVNQTRL